MQPEVTIETPSAPPPVAATEVDERGSVPAATEGKASGRRKALRIALKLFAAALLILVLILFTSSEVDFVYTGF